MTLFQACVVCVSSLWLLIGLLVFKSCRDKFHVSWNDIFMIVLFWPFYIVRL